jgi:hypothetical protein
MHLKKLQNQSFFLLALIFYTLLFGVGTAHAQEFTSSSFKVLDPVVTSGGGYSFSTSFRLDSSIGQIGIGTSSSSLFNLNADFLYFPYVTTPVISSTAGNGQVALSWTSASGVQGWTASGYNVGVGTVSGGPYTFSSSLGNVLSSTRTGVSNGTTYYFVIRVEDAYGNIIATSTQVSSTPVAPVTPPSGDGGRGGGGREPSSETAVIFSGKAYPKSTVTLLKDAQVAASTIAGTDASFKINLSGISAGNYIFSMYSEDYNGIRSSLVTFPVAVTSGVKTNVDGIFLAPTIAVDKSEVKRGDDIAIFGQSVPQSDIVISVHSDEEYFSKTVSDKDGIYLYNFDTSFLEIGSHTTKSKASIGNQLVSGYSSSVNFKVGTKNVLAPGPQKCPAKGDLNSDCKVNLVDFSIASFWYKRVLSEAFKVVDKAKLNGDGQINIVDFSIMAFYWTG